MVQDDHVGRTCCFFGVDGVAGGHGAFGQSDVGLRSRWAVELGGICFWGKPCAVGSEFLAFPGIRMGASGAEFSFLFRSDAEDLGIGQESFRSENLLDWSLISEEPVVTPAEGGYERVSYPIDPEAPKGFYRTMVPPPLGE